LAEPKYIHDGTRPVFITEDPIDPDTTGDWFYFCYGGYIELEDEDQIVKKSWLNTNESISSVTPVVSNATVVDGPYLLGDTTAGDFLYKNVYTVQVAPGTDGKVMEITMSVTTTTAGGPPDLGRLNIDRTIIVPIRQL